MERQVGGLEPASSTAHELYEKSHRLKIETLKSGWKMQRRKPICASREASRWKQASRLFAHIPSPVCEPASLIGVDEWPPWDHLA